MNKRVIFLRSCCWLGAILDARAAYALTLIRFHELPAQIAAQPGFHPLSTNALRCAGDAYALMWGWTALLVWASLKPVERRSALLITTFPVIGLLLFHQFQLWRSSQVAFSQIAFWFFFLIGLGALFAVGYFVASRRRHRESDAQRRFLAAQFRGPSVPVP